MDNIIVTSNKSHYFEFDIVIEGLDAVDPSVRFTILSSPYDISIPCKPLGQHKWSLDIPVLAFMEITTYKFCISVVVDGYYFEAHKGTFTLTKSPEVYVRTDDVKQVVKSKEPETVDIVVDPKIHNKPKEAPVAKHEPIIKPETKVEPVKAPEVKKDELKYDRDAMVASLMKDAAEALSDTKVVDKLKDEAKKEQEEEKAAVTEAKQVNIKKPVTKAKKPEEKKVTESIIKPSAPVAKPAVMEPIIKSSSPKKPQPAPKVHKEVVTEAVKEPVVSKQEQAIKAALQATEKHSDENAQSIFKKGGTVVK